MILKYSIKRAALVVGILALVSITGVAQENRSEISIQGTGFFTKDTAGNGVFERANDTGGFLLGYRYNFNRWLAAEANYGYDRNTQFYFGGTPARLQSDIHQITGEAVVKLPTFARLQPYALAGAGALVFDPTGNSGGSFAGATLETKRRSCTARAQSTRSPGTFHSEPSIADWCTRHRASTLPASTQAVGRKLPSHRQGSHSAVRKPRGALRPD